MGGTQTLSVGTRRATRPLAAFATLLLVVSGLITLPPTSGAVAPPTPSPAPQWSAATIDQGQQLSAVSCPSAQFCVAVDQGGNAITLSAGGWGPPTSIASSPLTSVSCPTTSFCVAVDQAGAAITLEQGVWQSPVPVDPSQDLVSVSCPSTQFCVAVDSVGNVVAFNGSSWGAPDAVDAGYEPTAVSCANSTMCKVVDGEGNVVSLSGSVWTTSFALDQHGFIGVSCPSTSFCMAPDDWGRVELYNGSGWTSTTFSGTTFEGVACPTTSFCVLDTLGGPYSYVGGTWSGYPQAIGAGSLTAVSCASASSCVTVGGGQAYVYAGSAIASSGNIDTHPLTAVSCESSAFCVAVDSAGNAVPFAAPTWGSPQDVDGTVPLTGVSCSGPWCLAVDGHGDALTYQSGAWSAPTPVPGVASFTGVSCVSSAFCVATDSLGSVLTLQGSTWSSPVDLDGAIPLTAVSCATTSFCVVAAGNGGGQMFTFSGSAWSAAPTDQGGSVQSLSCTSTTFCAGVDGNGNEVTLDGSTWSNPVAVRPTDPSVISCTSPTSCVAAGTGVAVSFGDGSAWTYPQDLGTSYEHPVGISCVPSFCAEVDTEGNATTVFDAGSTVTASSSPGGTAGTAVTYSTTVAGAWASQVAPTGSVAFAIGSVVQCTATLVNGSGTCTATTAPPGSDSVTATYSGDASHLGSAAPPFAVTVQPSPEQPVVSGVGSSAGCAVAGGQVTITGSNLSGVTAVDFGATASPGYSVTSSTTIVATVPPGTGHADVTVSNAAGSSIPTPGDQFSYGPMVTAISPSEPSGNALGGMTLYISGSGFSGATGIDVGGVAAASFQVLHDWAVEAVTPPGSGILDVTVTVGGCTSPIISADRYWAWPIVTSISPSTGPTAGGTAVTVTGAGFTGATAVDFGTNASPSFQVVSDSEIIAASPPAPYKVSVPVTVVTPMGTGDNSDANFLYYLYSVSGPPTITSFSPAIARAGTTMTISGTNLGDATSVEFGSTPAWFNIDSGTQLTTVVPDGASSGPVTVTGPNGTVTSTEIFTLTDPSTVLPTGYCGQVVADPTLPQVYVACGSTVSVFDDSGDLLSTIPNLPNADSMVVIGHLLYVHMSGTGSIAEINTGSFAVNTVFAAGITGTTSMVYAAGLLWACSAAMLDSVNPVTGVTTRYSSQYIADLNGQGLRPDPANPHLIYDLGAFSTIDVGLTPPTVTRPESLGATNFAISGASDGLMTPDGSHVLVDSAGLYEYDVHDPYAPVSQFDYGSDNYSAVTMSDAVNGGLVAAAPTSSGLDPVELFGLASAQPLASVSFGDDDAQIPAQCLAISPDGTNLFAVSEVNGISTFHAVPLTLPPAAPAFTSGAQANVVAGEASSVAVTTSGSPAASLTESGALPPGLTFTPGLDGAATISGMAAAGDSGNYPILVTATSTSGITTEDLTVTVDPVPTITSPSTETFTNNVAGYFTLTADGSPAPFFTESGTLPAGLVFTDYGNGTAAISGFPAQSSGGRYPVTVTVDNGTANPSSQTLEITVFGPPSITSPSSAEVAEGSPADVTVTTAGWPLPALSLTGALPSGLRFADNGDGTASITGTPSAGIEGTYQVQVQATNGTPSGYSATQTLTLTVADIPSVTSGNQADFTDGKPGSFAVATAGWPAATVAIVGTLPPGLAVKTGTAGSATIAGSPQSNDSGAYPVLVKASNGTGSGAEQALTLYAGPAGSVRPRLKGTTSYTFAAGTNGTYTLKATGSPTPTVSLAGKLPPGLMSTVTDGGVTLTGRALRSAAGTYALSVKATNAAGSTTQAITLTVTAKPLITSANKVTFVSGIANEFSTTATGGFPGPTTMAISGTLPSGVGFVDGGGGVGVLSGSPTTLIATTYSLTVEAHNGAGTKSQTFYLTVAP